MPADFQEVIRRLEAIDEELSDLAISKLRESIEGDSSAAGDERRITRARRAVKKAAGLLAAMPPDSDDI